MVSAIFETITSAITNAGSALASAITSVVSVFWTAGENGAVGSPTFLGTMLFIAVGFGLIYLVYRLIRGAIRGLAK